MSDTHLRIIDFSWKREGSDNRYISYVKVYNKSSNEILDISLENYNFDWVLTDKKVCIGRHEDGEYIPCTTILENNSGLGVRCDGCVQKDQFYNSFFKKAGAYGQNKEYLESSHLVYLAYFPYKRIKVGTASELRGVDRLIEQDSFIFSFIAETSNAYEAQELETIIHNKFNITSSITSASKLKTLHLKPIEEEAYKLLQSNSQSISASLGSIIMDEPIVINLLKNNDIFFPEYQIRNIINSTTLSGLTKGLRGRYLILENNNNLYTFDTQYLIGRSIESYVNSDFRYNQNSSNQLLLGV